MKKKMKAQKVSFLAVPSLLGVILISTLNSNWSTVTPIVLGGVVFVLFFEHLFKKHQPFTSIAISIMGIFYIVVPLSYLLKITFIPDNGIASGRFWIIFLILVTKAGDVGAYFIGKMIGKHYLAPNISPKKTYEGLIAGILSSIGMSFALMYLFPQAKEIFCPIWPYALGLGFSFAMIGFIGDLTESLLKRDAKVKDSNKMKGFGGFLDMFDSLIFTSPAFYLFLSYGSYI